MLIYVALKVRIARAVDTQSLACTTVRAVMRDVGQRAGHIHGFVMRNGIVKTLSNEDGP